MEQKKEIKIQIKASDAILAGTYANNLLVHMTREEFVLDFINIIPPTATLNARVAVSPGHMKRMIKALKTSLDKFEQEFGHLHETPSPVPPDAIVQ